MNKYIFASLTTAALIAPSVQAASWGTNLPAAQQQAAAAGKNVFVIFTGSDWCGPCIQLKRSVLSTEEFASYADENFVLVELDFPRNKKLPAAQQAANRKYSDQYKVRGFPTILVLSPEGKELARVVGGVAGLSGLQSELSSVTGTAPEGLNCVDGVCTLPGSEDDASDEAGDVAEIKEKIESLDGDQEAIFDYCNEVLEREELSREAEVVVHMMQTMAIVELAESVEELEDLAQVLKEDIIPEFEEDFPEQMEALEEVYEMLMHSEGREEFVNRER